MTLFNLLDTVYTNGMSSACKLFFEECIYHSERYAKTDDSLAEGKNVCIVMLSAHLSHEFIVTKSTSDWVNGYRINLHYGDITNESFYKEYMGLKTNPETAFRAKNSKGKTVIIQEEGWAPAGTEPTHMILHFITSCGKAFYGGVGNTLWLDNVKVIM